MGESGLKVLVVTSSTSSGPYIMISSLLNPVKDLLSSFSDKLYGFNLSPLQHQCHTSTLPFSVTFHPSVRATCARLPGASLSLFLDFLGCESSSSVSLPQLNAADFNRSAFQSTLDMWADTL